MDQLTSIFDYISKMGQKLSMREALIHCPDNKQSIKKLAGLHLLPTGHNGMPDSLCIINANGRWQSCVAALMLDSANIMRPTLMGIRC